MRPPKKECLQIFRRLLRYDTTNPPGNEAAAANFLAGVLRTEGIAAEVLVSAPNRGNLVASIGPGGGAGALLYLSHIDVVPATQSGIWKHPPFSGVVEGGWVYGRGAIDTKYLTAAQVMAMIILKRGGVNLKGRLKVAAVADEERGGVYGTAWLVKHYPELMRAKFAINEGGGIPIRIGNVPVYLVEAEEKGFCWVKVTAQGVAAHVSVPMLGVNAISKMSEAIDRISNRRPMARPSGTYKKMSRILLRLQRGKKNVKLSRKNLGSDKVPNRIHRLDPVFGASLQAAIAPSFSATLISGGAGQNIIPDSCEAGLDCRIPFGTTKADVIRELRVATKGIEGLQFEAIHYHPASRSPIDGPFYGSIVRCLKRTVGDSVETAPYVGPGTTDSRYLRPLGILCYGFAPTSPDSKYNELYPLIHGANERINLGSLWACTNFLVELAMQTLMDPRCN